jgi:ATP-dependent DNA ligase
LHGRKLLRELPLLERKHRLRKLLLKSKKTTDRLLYLGHLERNGSGVFQKVCELDLEGIVAKWKDGRYVTDNRRSSWVKIKNRAYSQAEGRSDLFAQLWRSKCGYTFFWIPARRAASQTA